jgi:hypothetical protein
VTAERVPGERAAEEFAAAMDRHPVYGTRIMRPSEPVGADGLPLRESPLARVAREEYGRLRDDPDVSGRARRE